MSNPWNLNERQVQVMAAMIKAHGRNKIAADALGVCPMTLTNRVRDARQKMGAPTRFTALLEWDRWVRARDLQVSEPKRETRE